MARREEHRQQVRLMARLFVDRPEIHELVFAVPNGGLRDTRVATQMSAEGLKPGVPDLMLPAAREGHHGLFVELKTDTGSLSPEQRQWHARLRSQGFRVMVCRSAAEAFAVIESYFDAKDENTISNTGQ